MYVIFWAKFHNFEFKIHIACGPEAIGGHLPPVDLHWFFEISIRTEKKFQLGLKKISVSLYWIFFQFEPNTEKKIQWELKKKSVSL